jgi:hypothetical protein
MKKRNPSSGQNSQLVHWWLLVQSGCILAQAWQETLLSLNPSTKDVSDTSET